MMVTPNGQPETDVEVGQTDQPAGAARLRNLVLPRGKGPTVGFETPLNTTLDVEVPLMEPALEAEGLHRRSRRSTLIVFSQWPPPRCHPNLDCRVRRRD